MFMKYFSLTVKKKYKTVTKKFPFTQDSISTWRLPPLDVQARGP